MHLARLRAHSGCDPEGGARAVPGRGFANCVRAVRKLARPATSPVCQELAARGADRLSATMKRGTGPSQGREVLARAAVERREASASDEGARRDERRDRRQRLLAGPRYLPRAFRRSASPLFAWEVF